MEDFYFWLILILFLIVISRLNKLEEKNLSKEELLQRKAKAKEQVEKLWKVAWWSLGFLFIFIILVVLLIILFG